MIGREKTGLRLVAAAGAFLLTAGLAAAAAPAAGVHPSQLDALRNVQKNLLQDAGPAGLAAARAQLDQLVREQSQVGGVPVAPSWLMTRLDALPPPAELAALGCVVALAATLAAAFAIMIAARRLGGARESAGAALVAGGTLFDGAARRFTRAQDEALREAEDTANQAASRLIAAARDTETRLRTCMGEAEVRIRAAGHLARRDERAMSNLPAMLVAALQTEAERGVPALDEAGFRLRDSADFLADRLAEGAGAFAARVEEAVAAALLRGKAALELAMARLTQENTREQAQEHASVADASPELPQAIDALAGIVTRLTDERRAQTAELAAALAGAEALASLLPEVTAALATTASGLRDMVTSGSEESETATAGLRAATQACADAVERLGTRGQEIVTAYETAGAALMATVATQAKAVADPPAAMIAAIEKLNDIAAAMDAQRISLSTRVADEEANAESAPSGIEAMTARADAVLALVPIVLADLAGAAAHLQARAGVLEEEIAAGASAERHAQASGWDDSRMASMLSLLTSRMDEGFADSLDAMRQQAGDLASNVHSSFANCATIVRDAQDSRTQVIAGDAISTAALSALASEHAEHTARLSGQLDTIADLIVSLGTGPRAATSDDREGVLMSTLGQIDRALLRVAAASEAQLQASSRAVDSVERVATARQAHPLSLSRFADLAAEVEALRAAADQLATKSLDAVPSTMPLAVIAAAPTLLASIELNIRHLRSTATALAIASDTALAAA